MIAFEVERHSCTRGALFFYSARLEALAEMSVKFSFLALDETVQLSRMTGQSGQEQKIMPWQLTDAKSRFSELFDRALSQGPQEVTRRGKERVYVVSAADYERLAGKVPTFKELILGESGPSFEGLDLSRDDDPGRKAPKL